MSADDETDAEYLTNGLAATEQVLPGVTPGAVLDAMDDPDAFASIARGDLYVQLAHYRRQAAHPEFSNNQRLEYMKFLARMGRVADPPRDPNQLDSIPAIQIVLPGSGGTVNIGAAPPPREEKDAGGGEGRKLPSKAAMP